MSAATFKRNDPMLSTAHGAFNSYESVLRPGWFISLSVGGNADPMGEPAPNTPERKPDGFGADLQPLLLLPRIQGLEFARFSTFEEARGEAEYPAASWWLQPPRQPQRSSLIYPLNEVVDETYSVYWDLNPGSW